MHIFKIIIFLNYFIYAQHSRITINSTDSSIIKSELENQLKVENRLSVSYILESFNYQSSETSYRISDQKKKIDSLIIIYDSSINNNTLSQIFRPYKLCSIDDNINIIGENIMMRYNFIYDLPDYHLGLINDNTLGAVIRFEPKFESYYSGMVGMDNRDNTWEVNGQFNLHLENYFKNAEYLEFFWSRLDSNSQAIKLASLIPHPFGWDVGIFFQYDYNLFNGLFTKIEHRYRFNTFSQSLKNISIGYTRGSYYPTLIGEKNGYNKSEFMAYTISLFRDLTNDRYLPNRGSKTVLEIDGGYDKKNYFINGILYLKKLYPLNHSYFVEYQFQFEGINYFNSQVPKHRYKWFGGASDLRGYNEDTFKSTQYHVSSISLCYKPYEKLQIKLFSDIGSDMLDLSIKNKLGYGFGLSQVNKNSVFIIEYGLSDRYLNNGKIHLKWISRL